MTISLFSFKVHNLQFWEKSNENNTHDTLHGLKVENS